MVIGLEGDAMAHETGDGSPLENATTPKGVYKKERKRRTDLSPAEQERLEKSRRLSDHWRTLACTTDGYSPVERFPEP